LTESCFSESFGQILTDIPICITIEEIIRSISQGKHDLSRIYPEIEKAVEKAEKLWQPKIVYKWINVKQVKGESLILLPENKTKPVILNLGQHAGLMKKAKMAFICVNSIGQELDNQVQKLNKKGKPLDAYLLDSAGVAALSKVDDTASALAEKEAAYRDWGVGARLSPGSLQGWPVEDQHILCSLLPLKDSGIKLNEYGVLIPFKSASGMIGIGPGYTRQKTGSACRFCTRRHNCLQRKNDLL